jgi:REP-associated tyrosine transposase
VPGPRKAVSCHRTPKAILTDRYKNKDNIMHWHHGPYHFSEEKGTYFVTAATLNKHKIFNTPERLDFLHDSLLEVASEFGWRLHVWAVLANHYHFMGECMENDTNLRKLLSKLHMITAKRINELDATPGRKVWHQYWDKQITFQKSYLARFKYTLYNPVKHGIVKNYRTYRWSSIAQFTQTASDSFQKRIEAIKTDKVQEYDEF